jgi:hypothetical protein
LTLDGGSVGYLRESYTGGPYVTKILARDAFESPSRQAQIPAVVLRERLTSVTEPAYGLDAGCPLSLGRIGANFDVLCGMT